jgi:hypothetical protein
MPRPHVQFVKLTRPRLHDAVPCQRLFAVLVDASDKRGAICVVCPLPGPRWRGGGFDDGT